MQIEIPDSDKKDEVSEAEITKQLLGKVRNQQNCMCSRLLCVAQVPAARQPILASFIKHLHKAYIVSARARAS